MACSDVVPSYPPRPGFGRAGRRIDLLANFFEVKSFPRNNIHHYDVQISPSGLPKSVNRSIMAQMFQTLGPTVFEGIRPAYDGEASFYMPKRLSFQNRVEKVKLPGRRDEFTVKIEHAAEINMESLQVFIRGKQKIDIPQTCIQALDVVLKTIPALHCTMIGSSFFSGLDRVDLGIGGAEIWRGYYQSVRPAHGRVLVNLDTAATCFYVAQPLLELVRKELKMELSQLSPNHFKKIESIVKGLKVEVTHQKQHRRKYRIHSVVKMTANSQTFEIENEDGSKHKTNVTQYFKQRYQVALKYPNMPLAKVGSGPKAAFLPLEVCHIADGERVSKKLSAAQTAEMIKATAQKPNARANTIVSRFRERNYTRDESALAFGIKVDSNLMALSGRVLESPKIVFDQQRTVQAQLGAWQCRNSAFFRSASLSNWAVLILDQKCRVNTMQDFVGVLCKVASDVGFKINPRPVFAQCPRGPVHYQDAIMRAVAQAEKQFRGPVQLLYIVLPFNDTKAYGEIKRICDTVVDVPSQCMQAKHVYKKSPMYCRNIILKMNVKLGGMNSIIERSQAGNFLFNVPAIVFGADVSHASPGSTLPSLAAVVASMDAYPYRYETQVRAQSCRQEMIADLKVMAKSLLISFYRATGGRKPQKILFYRDGVSEGQYDAVLKHELTALRQACADLEADYTPKITFVICAKRHHARFFCKNPKDGDRSGNIPPGTVVDTTVVHPRQFDFYLVSHSGIQGTSRPCHYHVLWDENKFTPDILQQLTYRQCFMYARCMRSVSIVPAAYYAHLVAFRARYHAKADEWDSPSSSDTPASLPQLPPIQKRNSSIMYFM